MSETTFASRIAAMMRARDLEFISRSRIGTGLVSRGGRVFVVHYDECSDDEREILTEQALASFLSGAENDPWGYTASVVAQAREALAAAHQTAIVSGCLTSPVSRRRARPFAAALLGVELDGDGTAAVPVSDFPWFIDTTLWTTGAGVVRVLVRRDDQNEARPHEHGLEIETASFTVRFEWTAADAFTRYTVEGADDAIRDRVIDAVVKASTHASSIALVPHGDELHAPSGSTTIAFPSDVHADAAALRRSFDQAPSGEEGLELARALELCGRREEALAVLDLASGCEPDYGFESGPHRLNFMFGEMQERLVERLPTLPLQTAAFVGRNRAGEELHCTLLAAGAQIYWHEQHPQNQICARLQSIWEFAAFGPLVFSALPPEPLVRGLATALGVTSAAWLHEYPARLAETP